MSTPPVIPPKRQGIGRLVHALGYSWSGLRMAWAEPAFRQEALAAIVLLPAAFWLGQDWATTVLLIGSVLLVMVVEILNTAIEAVVDRFGPEWHEQSKRAKDLGSAAVLLALLACGGVWVSALWRWWFS